MTIEERRAREKADRRNAILAAAGELFSERGYEATMDEVAERAELSKPTLYLYFKNKDDLYASIAIEGFSGLKQRFVAISGSGEDVEARFRSMFRAFIDFVTANPQVARITEFVFTAAGRGKLSDEVSGTVGGDISELLGYASSVITEGIEGGVFADSIDPFTVSVVLWRAMLGVVAIAIEDALPGRPPGFYDELFDATMFVLTEGIKKR